MIRRSLPVLLACALGACAQPQHASTPSLAAPETATRKLTVMDQAVIDCALADFLDTLSSKLPLRADGTKAELTMSVEATIGPLLRTTDGLLDRLRPEDWAALPAALLPSLRPAADDLVERATFSYTGFTSSDPRIRVPAEPSFEEAMSQISVSAPGYGPDCELAIVEACIPMGVAHLSYSTWVLARSPSGWCVLVRPTGSRR
jgi:hypothetical protein